jgi:hypothetical protein
MPGKTADKFAPEVRVLPPANDILRKVSANFAEAELHSLRLPSNDAAHHRDLLGRLRPFKR